MMPGFFCRVCGHWIGEAFINSCCPACGNFGDHVDNDKEAKPRFSTVPQQPFEDLRINEVLRKTKDWNWEEFEFEFE